MPRADHPYTDNDLRTEATRQYAEVLDFPDRLEVGDEMQGQPIASTVVDLEPETGEPLEMSRTWGQLSGDGFHTSRNEVHKLLEGAADVSQWAINLGADVLVPSEHHVDIDCEGVLAVRIHYAFHMDLPQHLREAFIAAIHASAKDF